jgi:hypothetical protein
MLVERKVNELLARVGYFRRLADVAVERATMRVVNLSELRDVSLE